MIPFVLKRARKLKDIAVRHRVRLDVLILAAVLFISSGILYVIPGQTETYVPPAAFVPTPRTGWFFAGYLTVPAGDALGASFQSNTQMIVAFANSSSWQSFVAGNASSPGIVSSGRGLSGSFVFHTGSDAHIALVGFWNPQNMDYFKVLLTGYDYHAFNPYSELMLWLGAASLCIAFGYERLRKATHALRSGRL